jgi:hypothetical protein
VIITAAQYQQKDDYVSSSNLSGSPKRSWTLAPSAKPTIFAIRPAAT